MKLSSGLNMAALAMFFVSLVFASVPFALGGATLAALAAFLKGVVNE